MVPPLDECKFCVREFWKPWLQQLLDIEDEARVEERQATFGARDALSKSERDLALNLRLYAAEALLAIRAAKKDVMKAIAAIEAEKAKRKSIDKEKYGIEIKRSETATCYKEAMAKAFKSKQIQEHKFEIMKLWSAKWVTRRQGWQVPKEEDTKHKAKSTIKPKDTDEHKPNPSSFNLLDMANSQSTSLAFKPAIKKKEDGKKKETSTKPSIDKKSPEKTQQPNKEQQISKDKGKEISSPDGSSHVQEQKEQQVSKDKGKEISSPDGSSHVQEQKEQQVSKDKGKEISSPDRSSSVQRVDKGVAIPEKEKVMSPAHGADKGSVTFTHS